MLDAFDIADLSARVRQRTHDQAPAASTASATPVVLITRKFYIQDGARLFLRGCLSAVNDTTPSVTFMRLRVDGVDVEGGGFTASYGNQFLSATIMAMTELLGVGEHVVQLVWYTTLGGTAAIAAPSAFLRAASLSCVEVDADGLLDVGNVPVGRFGPRQVTQASLTVDASTSSGTAAPLVSQRVTTKDNGKLLLRAQWCGDSNSPFAGSYLSFFVDGVQYVGSASSTFNAADRQTIACETMTPVLAAGGHDVSLAWRAAGGTSRCLPVTDPSNGAIFTIEEYQDLFTAVPQSRPTTGIWRRTWFDKLTVDKTTTTTVTLLTREITLRTAARLQVLGACTCSAVALSVASLRVVVDGVVVARGDSQMASNQRSLTCEVLFFVARGYHKIELTLTNLGGVSMTVDAGLNPLLRSANLAVMELAEAA